MIIVCSDVSSYNELKVARVSTINVRRVIFPELLQEILIVILAIEQRDIRFVYDMNRFDKIVYLEIASCSYGFMSNRSLQKLHILKCIIKTFFLIKLYLRMVYFFKRFPNESCEFYGVTQSQLPMEFFVTFGALYYLLTFSIEEINLKTISLYVPIF